MTTTNTRRFEISNINTGIVFGVYEGRNEGEALDAYASDAGYTDFNAACEASGTHAEDIACEEVLSEVDDVIEGIKSADSLDSLKDAIIRYNGLSRDDKASADMRFSFDNLPTFGEDYIEEAECEGVFSWDRTRLLILDGAHVEIRDREIKNTVDGRDVVIFTGDFTKGTVNPIIKARLDGSMMDCPVYTPENLRRVAALAQKLNLKMTGPSQYLFLTHEEQVLVDENDGLMILVSGQYAAWEAFGDNDND